MVNDTFVFEEHINEIVNLSDYSFVQAYHACRSDNIKSYYQNGFCHASKNELFIRVINLFSKYASLEKIKNVFEDQWQLYESEMNSHFFCLNKDYLLNSARFYLLGGSEFIFSCGIRVIENNPDLLWKVISKQGTPTIITCKIPIEYVCESDKEMNFEPYDINSSIKTKSFPGSCIVQDEKPHGSFYFYQLQKEVEI